HPAVALLGAGVGQAVAAAAAEVPPRQVQPPHPPPAGHPVSGQRAEEPPPDPAEVAPGRYQPDRVIERLARLSDLVQQPECPGPVPERERVADRRGRLALPA